MTEQQKTAIRALLDLARATYLAVDDGEELNDGKVVLEACDAKAVESALEALEAFPDDRPGYVMAGPAKAAWALRDLLTPN